MGAPAKQPIPEKQLLVACARTSVTDKIAARIRQLAAGPFEWDLLLLSAAENSVLPLLARNLPTAAPGAFSPDQFDRLRKAARASGIHSLQLSAELIRIMDAFGASGIAAYPYKGPLLAAQAYGDLALREFEDLDILLSQRDMLRASEILTGLNYKPRFPWIFSREADAALVPGEYNFSDAARGVMVELHTERTLRHFPVPPNFSDMAEHLVPVALSGHEIMTFCPEDMLVLLCVHGSKDFWERISWVADISEFVQSQPGLDWDRVLRRAESLKAQRMLFLGLELASRVVAAPVPAPILSKVRGDAVVGEIATRIEQGLLGAAAAKKGAAGSFAYRRQMVPGAMAGWRYSLRLATAPAEEDWMVVQLPRVLSPLYLALRPLRLLRKYGAAGKTAGN